MASAVLSLVKNKVDLLRGTDLEKKVKEATSNENWGASSTLKNEIARATYDYEGFREVMPLIWKRMTEEGRNWRIVFKSLVLLEHLLRLGSERAVQDAKDRVFQVRQLQDFQYIDENGKDQGTGVREQAKLLVGLLQDDDKLKEARENARSVLNKVKGASSMGNYGGFGSDTGFGSSYGGSGGGGGGGYDEDSRFGRSSWDAPDSRDSGSRSSTTKRSSELENDFKKKDKEKEKEKEKKKKEKEKEKEKEHHHHHSSHKKKNKEESEEEEEEEAPQEKKSSKKSSKHKKHESDEEEAPDSDDDKHRSKKSEKGKKEESKKSKIKVQLSDKPASSSSASKGAKLAAPKNDSTFSADFDANFPEESHAPATSNRGQSSFNADFEADFDALAGSGPSRQPARAQHDDFGSFSSAPAPAPARPAAASMGFDSFGFQSAAPAPAARFDTFDMMDQPVNTGPSVNSGFDLISAVSHTPAAKTPQNKGKQQQSSDGFLDFESANTQSSAPAPKPSAKSGSKDVWDMGGLVKLDNLSVSEPAKATAAAKPAASSGPFIDLGPSRRAGGGSAAAPANSGGGYGFDIGFGGPANHAANNNNFGGMNMGFGGPAMPPQMGGYPPMGGYGAPPQMGYGMGGYGMGMPPGPMGGPMGGMNMGYGAPAGRGRGMPPSGFM